MQGDVGIADPHSLLRVADAWRNGPALSTLLITFVAVALLGLVGYAYRSSELLPVAATLCIAFVTLGLNAAGSQFAEQAGGRPVSSVARAFAATPRIVLRVLLLAGALLLVLAGFVLLGAAVLFACRLPVVGPGLYVVALPVLTIAGAALLLALTAAALLSLPALWEGHSLRTAFSQLCAIATQRKCQAFANLVLVFAFAAAVAAVVSAFVLAGFRLTAGLTVPVSGSSRIGDAFLPWFGGSPIGGADAFVVAGSVGAALVFAITVALLAAVFLFGLAIAYLRSTDGIDIAAARAALGRAIVETQVKKAQVAEDMRARVHGLRSAIRKSLGAAIRAPIARTAADEAPLARPAVDASAIEPETAPAARACSHCGSPAETDDRFCGSCGQLLQG